MRAREEKKQTNKATYNKHTGIELHQLNSSSKDDKLGSFQNMAYVESEQEEPTISVSNEPIKNINSKTCEEAESTLSLSGDEKVL